MTKKFFLCYLLEAICISFCLKDTVSGCVCKFKLLTFKYDFKKCYKNRQYTIGKNQYLRLMLPDYFKA